MSVTQTAAASAQYADRLLPHVLAEQVIPGFKAYKHTRLLCNSFASALRTRRNRFQIWTLDPQVGKTMAVKACAVWALDWNPRLGIIYWTYNDLRGGVIGSDVRSAFEDNRHILRTTLREDSTAKNHWRTPEGGGFISRTRFKGEPGNVIFVDDPFADLEEFQSAAHRLRVWRKWLSDVIDRFGEDVVVIVVMTRGHPEDLVGQIKKQNPELWHHIHIPALADPNIVDPDPLGRQPGEPTCPAIHSRESRLLQKSMMSHSPWVWQTVYQGVPMMPDGQKFLREYWRYLDRGVAPERRVVTISSWDLTFKKDGPSWCVGQKWVLDGQSRYSLVDQVRERADYHDQKRLFKAFREKHRHEIQFDLVEDKANGSALLSDLAHAEWYRALGGQTVAIPVPPGQGKELRAEANLPLFVNGQVFLPGAGVYDLSVHGGSDHVWIDDVLDEHAAFPNGLTDDVVDTTSQALAWLRKKDVQEQGAGLQVVRYQ